jgi:hypothetical protein
MNRETEIPLPVEESGRTLIYDGLAQNDIDMANYRLLNLDTTNLPPIGIPPTIHPPANQWLHDWDGINHVWTATRPTFLDIGPDNGTLTRDQQLRISSLGDVRIGQWNATPLAPNRVPRLDLIMPPQDNLSINNKRVVNVANPVDPNDAVNKGFMDMLLQGLNPKAAVRVASPGSGRPWPGPGGLGVIDGVEIQDGDRVLLYSYPPNTAYHEGIWIARDAVNWERAPDTLGVGGLDRAYVHVLEGDLNAGTSWVQVATLAHNPPQLGDDPNWILFSTSGATILPGSGLTKDGNTLNVVGTPGRIWVGPDNVDIDPAYTGQDSITNLGHVTEGRWNAELIEGAYGGTGVQNSGKTISICGNFSTFMPLDSPDITAGRALIFALLDNTRLTLPTAGMVATVDHPETFTNKRIEKRVASFVAFARPAIDTDNNDVYKLTAQDQPILSFTDNLSGTPTDGQELEIFIEEVHEIPPPPAPPDIPVVQSFPITWGDAFRDSGTLKLPQVTVGLGGIYVKFVFNTDHGKWWLVNRVDDFAL